MENSLRKIRKAAGYKSARAFAESIGMPATTYAKYEQAADDGEVSMPLKSAWAIADALGCTIDALVGREEVPDLGMRGDMQRRYDALSDDNKELVDGFVTMIEDREEKSEAQRKAERAQKYMPDARKYELQFLESAELLGDSDDIVFFGSDEDMRDAFEAFASARIAEAETRRVEMLLARARKTKGDDFDLEEYGMELNKQADARAEEVMEGVMAAYDMMHPAMGAAQYAMVNLK